MQLLQLTQCDELGQALHPIWVNPAYIVSIDRTPSGTTMVRTVIGAGFVIEKPNDIEAALLEIHLDIALTEGIIRNGGNKQAGT